MAASTLFGPNAPATDCVIIPATSVTSATDIFALDVRGFDRIAVQVTSAGTTCTVTYEVSLDNNNWVAIAGYAPATPQTETTTTTTAAGITVFRCDGQFFRARVSTYGSGTVTAQAIATSIHTAP